MQIVIDTNILIYGAKNKVDIVEAIKEKFGSIKIFVPNLVSEELKKLKANSLKKKDREIADLALDILRNKKFSPIMLAGPTDEAIADWAQKNNVAVLTNDVELKFSLREKGVSVYNLRQGKLIEEW
ncbi:MAG: hypothetical protein HYT16_04405 [DPANN group archaeon]|nr:hypothetical protein [DPANN group archaeon]